MRRKRFPRPPFPSEDFKWHFRRILMAIIVIGFYELREREARRLEARVRKGEIRSFGLGRSTITLPCSGRMLEGLHEVFKRMIDEHCFPAWFRARIFISNDYIHGLGPYSEDLENALRETAFMSSEGKFERDYLEGSFQLILDYGTAWDYLEKASISKKNAIKWGIRFFELWTDVQREARELRESLKEVVPALAIDI